MLRTFLYIVMLCLVTITAQAQSGTASVCVGQSLALCSSSLPPGGLWTSSNTTIATVSGTGIVLGVSAGTVSISYTFTISGCAGSGLFITDVTVNPLPAATPSFDPVCVGSTTLQLHANHVPDASCSTYNYSWSGPGGWTSSLANPSRSPVAVGVYTLSIVNTCTNCASVYTVNVTYGLTIDVVETVPMSVTGDHVFTYASGMELKAVGTPSLTTSAVYSWVGASGLVSTTNTYRPSLSVCGIYSYTVTVSDGTCTTTSIDTIIVPCSTCPSPYDYYNVNTYRSNHGLPALTSCSDCGTTLPFHTITAGSLNSTNVADNDNYFVANTSSSPINVYLDKTHFTGDVFFVDKDVTLLVDPTFDATVPSVLIDSCHFFSSDSNSCKWRGIKVAVSGTYAGHLETVNSTLIEDVRNGFGDAGVGLSIVGSGNFYTTGMIYIINSGSAIYNRSYQGIRVKDYMPAAGTGDLPFKVGNCIFTNRDFASNHTGTTAAANYPVKWPSVSSLKSGLPTTAANPIFGVGDYHAYGNTAGVGHTGIYLENVGLYQTTLPTYTYDHFRIGLINVDPSYQYTNLFDSLEFGVQMVKANGIFNNNIFSNIGLQAVGVANDTNDVQLTGVQSDHTNNWFYDCVEGVRVAGTGTRDFLSSGTCFSSDNVNTMTSFPADKAYYFIVSTGHNEYEITGNSIYNYNLGIYAQYVGSAFASYSYSNGNFNIHENTFTGVTSGGSEYMSYAIRLEDARNIGGLSNGVIDIHNNSISGVGIGISYFSRTMNCTIVANTVNVTPYTSLTGKGVYSFGSPYLSSILENIIGGTEYCNMGQYGINVDSVGTSGARTSISCNSTYDVGVGFKFEETNFVDWRNNQMIRNYYGMELDGTSTGPGTIGVQGTPCDPIDNHWDDGTTTPTCTSSSTAWSGWTSTSGVLQTYISSSAAHASTSTLYVRPGAVYMPVSTRCGAGGGGVAYSPGSTIIDGATGCMGLHGPSSCSNRALRPVHAPIPTTHGDYTLYPNPSDGNIVIVKTVKDINPVTVSVFNSLGQHIYTGKLEFAGDKSSLKLPNIAPGVYDIRLMDSYGEMRNKKVIIER